MKKGISLAVLVVTIIVLVILTAATMATINGENGVIDEARLAAEDSKRQNAEDKLYMELAAVQIKAAKVGQTVSEYLNVPSNKSDFLTKGITSATVGIDKIIFVVDNQTIETDLNGNIQKTEQQEPGQQNPEPQREPKVYSCCEGFIWSTAFVNGVFTVNGTPVTVDTINFDTFTLKEGDVITATVCDKYCAHPNWIRLFDEYIEADQCGKGLTLTATVPYSEEYSRIQIAGADEVGGDSFISFTFTN